MVVITYTQLPEQVLTPPALGRQGGWLRQLRVHLCSNPHTALPTCSGGSTDTTPWEPHPVAMGCVTPAPTSQVKEGRPESSSHLHTVPDLVRGGMGTPVQPQTEDHALRVTGTSSHSLPSGSPSSLPNSDYGRATFIHKNSIWEGITGLRTPEPAFLVPCM